MLSKSELRSKNNELAAKKVKLIYELLCDEDLAKLLELFTNEQLFKEKTNYSDNRKKWLQKVLNQESVGKEHLKKEYQYLKLSKLYLKNRLAFDEDIFFDSDLEDFKKRIEEYVEYQKLVSTDIDLAYRYIYLYDEKLKKIVYYQVVYSDINAQKELPIKVYPPECKKECGEYIGTIKKTKNQMVLVFENSFDMIHIIFNSLLEKSNHSLAMMESYFGLAIGVDDQNRQTPLARKVMFCKRILNDIEKEKLYLILNETQTLEAKESIYMLDSKLNLDADYVAKYYQNVKDMHTFFSNIKYSKNIDTGIMHHMVFTEFHVYQKMFEKFSFKQDYFLRDRKRVCLEFIRFLQSHSCEKVMLSLPIFDKKDNIFLIETHEKKSIKTLFVELAKSGMCIEIIFVIKIWSDYDNNQMRKVAKELDEAGVEIHFVNKRDVDRVVSSYDFCCTQDGIDAIYKSPINFKEMFTITRNSETIKNLMMDFKKLHQLGHSYEDIKNGKKTLAHENTILNKLLGTWHIYFYGSYNYQDGTPVFWNTKIEIKSDLTVVEYGKKSSLGYGRVEFFKNIVLVSIVSAKTDSIFYMVVDNNKISEVTSAMIYAKQEQINLDMSSIGIASRLELMNDEAKHLLGDGKTTTLKESVELKNRVDEFVLRHKAAVLEE